MTQSKRALDTKSIRWFIAAAAATGVIGGWAVFSLDPSAAARTAAVSVAQVSQSPTLVAPPGQAQGTQAGRPSAPQLRLVSPPPPVTITRSSR